MKTIEEKAKAYDKALHYAKIYYSEGDENMKIMMSTCFPELEESEDENVREELIKHLKEGVEGYEPAGDSSDYQRWLAWLEKQGQVKESTISQHENRTCKENDDSLTSENDRIRKDIKQHFLYLDDSFPDKAKWLTWLEKQGEQISADADNKFIRMRETKPKDISEFLDRLTTVEQEFLWEHIAKIRELDKEEQKSADKVESKFKVGDFIANDYCFGKVIALTDDAYLLDTEQGIPFSCEHNTHLWTIADAKDGDILVNWNNTIFIFKTIEDETVKFHIAYNEKWDAIKTPSTKLSHLGFPEPQFEFHPATEEQRSLLFRKMKDAGYEWSDKDRKLIKIVK